MKTRKRVLAVALAAALSFGLSGCGMASGIISALGGEKAAPSPSPSPSPKSPSPSPSTPGGKPPAPSPSPSPGGGVVNGNKGKFGQSVRTDKGVTVTVSTPVDYTPSDTAAGHKPGTQAIKFDVTLRNDSGAPLKTTMLLAILTENGKEASQIFDVGQLDSPPYKPIPNGQEVKYKIAFGVTSKTGLELEYNIDFIEDHIVTFTQ